MDNKTYQLGLYEKALPNDLNWRDKLRLVKKLKFDFIEISIDESDERLNRLWDDDFKNELKLLIDQEGVSVRSMCLSAQRKYPFGSKDKAIQEKSMKIFMAAVDMAYFLGIRTIQLAGYDVYYETSDNSTKKTFEDQLLRAIQYASKYSVMCAFETMETNFMNTVEKAMVYVDLIKSPYCGVYPDLGNLKNANIDETILMKDIRLGKGHLVAAHLKETVPDIFREIPFGTGHVNFRNGISQLYDLGVRTFVCECWYVGDDNYEQILKFNNSFLRNYLDQIETGHF